VRELVARPTAGKYRVWLRTPIERSRPARRRLFIGRFSSRTVAPSRSCQHAHRLAGRRTHRRVEALGKISDPCRFAAVRLRARNRLLLLRPRCCNGQCERALECSGGRTMELRNVLAHELLDARGEVLGVVHAAYLAALDPTLNPSGERLRTVKLALATQKVGLYGSPVTTAKSSTYGGPRTSDVIPGSGSTEASAPSSSCQHWANSGQRELRLHFPNRSARTGRCWPYKTNVGSAWTRCPAMGVIL
jgi:hypothetical protein